jgi:hypothetical protein
MTMKTKKKRKPKSLSKLRKEAWSWVSKYVRQREADEGGFVGCYTCGAPIHAVLEAQAGHAIPGRTNSILLDDSICRPQCYGCNIARSGMHHVFATKLIKENGLEWWEAKLAQAREVVKFTRADLEDLIAAYKAKLEML